MPLVEYGSSSDDDDGEQTGEDKTVEKENPVEFGPSPPPSAPPPSLRSGNIVVSPRQQSDCTSSSSSHMEKLPDASLLLSSPSFLSHQLTSSDHSSRVIAAMAETTSRKREANGSALPHSRSKLPKGSLPHSRSMPDTMGGTLIPPQLRGRSNVVTEDMGKLFVRRQSE